MQLHFGFLTSGLFVSQKFAKCLKNGISHPNIHLGFRYGSFGASEIGYAGLSQIHALEDNEGPVAATWYYSLGDFTVQVFWHHTSYMGEPPANTWHPKQRSKHVKFSELREL